MAEHTEIRLAGGLELGPRRRFRAVKTNVVFDNDESGLLQSLRGVTPHIERVPEAAQLGGRDRSLRSAGKGLSGVWLGAKGWAVAAVLAAGSRRRYANCVYRKGSGREQQQTADPGGGRSPQHARCTRGAPGRRGLRGHHGGRWKSCLEVSGADARVTDELFNRLRGQLPLRLVLSNGAVVPVRFSAGAASAAQRGLKGPRGAC